ncbi:protein stunted isoform X2 [Papilio machaon]|uniref:protein stunted isoform X2 n=1 Tax=Papilio machaon TaxID=76193 RepID=UPI0006EAE44C|nr:protein stunted isoform X2 [Papilio machaon]
MSAWRQAGLSYINYSNIAAKVLRRSLKPEFRSEALKRDESHVRITPWANGRPAHEKE